jgi:hypothetical protein
MDNVLYVRVRALFGTVLVISLVTLGLAALVGGNAAVWIRGTIVAAIAIVVIIALPHDGFPVWMKIEQAVVGVLLLAVAIMVGRRAVRQAYAKHGQQVR